MWLMGLLASMYTRPHLLTDTGLVVRDSVFNELSVPYDAILRVAQVDHPNSGRSGLKLSPADRTAVMAYGIANVEISSASPCRSRTSATYPFADCGSL